jgi:hypothetical protein
VDARAHVTPALDGTTEDRTFSTASIARSIATQHITLECVKCRGSPRISQMPLSARCQFDSRNVTSVPLKAPAVVVVGEPGLAGDAKRVHQLSIDVELQLRSRRRCRCARRRLR